ncbi:MAG: flagellar motor protein MotB [Planctomycetota bacterium]|jgi:flagellar motor protein MotB
MHKLLHSSVGRCTIGVTLLITLSSCVAKQRYDESQDWGLKYQRELHASEKRVLELEAENGKLRGQVNSGTIGTLEAASPVADNFESRIGALKSQLMGLDRPPGPIERFDVPGGYVYMIQDKVLFKSGSFELGQAGRTELLKLATEINSKGHGRIMVRGHTDNVPVVKPATLKRLPYGNLQLSAMRAVSVGDLLIQDGKLSGSDVVVQGFGEWEPIAANDSDANKRLNRRVEIFVEEVAQ